MYSKLIFIRKCNPMYEDFFKKYSTIRFYSETIVALAYNLGIKEIDILYFDETYASDDKTNRGEQSKEWYNSNKDNIDSDYPIIRMNSSAQKYGISLNIENIRNASNFSDSLLVLSFMTDTPKVLKWQFDSYINNIARDSKACLYLSSDNEYSGVSYKKDGQIGCLEYIGDNEPTEVIDKLRCIVMTESNSKGIVQFLENKFNAPVFYLPMIIDNRDIRFSDDISISDKSDKVAMLKNLTFFKDYVQFFESIRDHGVVWESSMPPIQRKFKPICEKYGLEYKFARFWRMNEFENKISDYKFFLGMSTVGSSRFTSKILEGTNANTYVISPLINLEIAGFSKEDYPLCFSTLEKSGIGEVLTADVNSEEECDISLKNWYLLNKDISDEEYKNRLRNQREFIINYFTVNSPCVIECLDKIIPYLQKVGEL